MVYGTLQLNKNTNLLSESAFRRASDKDPMLDMLNKKGRIGGDEILIVTKDIYDKATLRPYLRVIRTNMEMMYKGKLNGISLTCSIGAAAYPIHADSFRETMELADKMLYLAKEKGRNRYVIFTPEMHSEYVKNASNGVPDENRQVAEYDRIGIMHYMLKDYLTCQTCTDEYIFTQIGEGFRLNEILCSYNHGNVGYRWTSDGEKLHEKLTARKIESVLFYRLMKNGKPNGFIMFARRHQRQKWSEYEVRSLSMAAKIFELSIADSR